MRYFFIFDIVLLFAVGCVPPRYSGHVIVETQPPSVIVETRPAPVVVLPVPHHGPEIDIRVHR